MKRSVSNGSVLAGLWAGKFRQVIGRVLGDEQQKNAIPVLDGLRGIACLSVIVFHMNALARFTSIWNPSLDGVGAWLSAAALCGESGVILFFLLSAFLLFLPYARALLFDSPWPSLRRFYTRRIFRILPGYYVALGLLTIFTAPQYLQQAHWYEFWLFLTMRMDFPPTFQLLNGPFWTLAIEFQFYILLPLLAWIMRPLVRWGELRWRMVRLICCVLAVLVWGLATRYWGVLLGGNVEQELQAFLHPHSFAPIIRAYIFGRDSKYFDVFAIGLLLSMLYVYWQYAPEGERQRRLLLLSPWIFGLGLAVLGFMSLWHFWTFYIDQTLHFFDAYWVFSLRYRYFLPPVCYALGYGLCMFGLLHGPAWLKRPFESAPLRWAALISFSLYMWHFSLITFFLTFMLPIYQKLGWSPLAQGCVYWLWMLFTTFPLSIVLYRLVEVPGIRLGEHLCRRWERRGEPPPEPIQVSDRVPVVGRRECDL